MNDANRIAEVRRYFRGELDDEHAGELALRLVDDPDVVSILADAAEAELLDRNNKGAPRIATHAFSKLHGLAPFYPEALAMTGDGGADARVLDESLAGDGLEAVVLLENNEIVVYVTDESEAPIPNATVTLRSVLGDGRSERRAAGRTDTQGRLSLGRSAFFTPPVAPGFYQLSVLVPPGDAAL